MRGDDQAVFNDNFPDPAEQAEALLESCQGDVCEAQTITATNFKYAKYRADQLYWSRVEVLLLQQGPAAVMERLANSRLRRRTQRR
jgi:predicted lipoprotein